MAKIERFEDLQSWQTARQLTNLVYDLTDHPTFSRDFRLCNQIRSAAGSIMHNIAQGFDMYQTATEAKRLINGMIGYLRRSTTT